MEIYKYDEFVEIYEATRPNKVQGFANKMKAIGKAGEIGSEIGNVLTKDKKSWLARTFGKVSNFAGKWFGNLFNVGKVLGDIFGLFSGLTKKEDVEQATKKAKEQLSDLVDKIKGAKEKEIQQNPVPNESIVLDNFDEQLINETYSNVYEMIYLLEQKFDNDKEVLENLDYITNYIESIKI